MLFSMIMIVIFYTFTLLIHFTTSYSPVRFKSQRFLTKLNDDSQKARLLQNPLPNSIGNFFESIEENMSFIQCYMLSLGEIDGTQYGVGFPVDMPVMLSYFEDDELKPVRPEYPDYDHLVNHVSMQMDDNDFQLYKTPVVLTLQGEFEDEELNQIVEGIDDWGDEAFDEKFGHEDINEGDEEDEELTLKELLEIENIDGDWDDDEDFGDDFNDEEEADEDADDADNPDGNESFWNSSPVGKMTAEMESIDDFTIIRAGTGAVDDKNVVAQESLVSDEDTKSLRRAHRRADRIMEYASDIKLIASFNYKKKNFHLIKLLEPIFIIGKRIKDIKGYYFTLLEDEEAARITPQLEELITNQRNDRSKYAPLGKSTRTSDNLGVGAVKQASVTIGGSGKEQQQIGRDAGVRTSRRRWSERKQR